VALLTLLPPRSYIDVMVPHRKDGSLLTVCNNQEDYEEYVSWLAEYLHRADIPLPEAQQRWIEEDHTRNWAGVVFECADYLGYCFWELSAIEVILEQCGEYVPDRCECRKIWENDETLNHDPNFFDEWFADIEEACARITREHREMKRVGRRISHADIPYRPLLAWSLRQVDDPDQRRDAVDFYFERFNENASK
jgi:hypothetical protein